MTTIKIDKEFSKRLRPLTADELARLEAGIQANGCIKPLVVWQPHNILLDGHNRYKLCQKHGIGFRVVNVKLPDREAALNWIDDHQDGQRSDHTSAYAKAETVYVEDGEDLAKAASERMKAGTGRPSTPEGVGSGEVAVQVARKAGVSKETARKTKAVMDKGSEELKQQLRDGKISLAKAYDQMMEEAKAAATAKKAKPPTDKVGNVLPDKPSIREAFLRDSEITALMSAVSKLKGEIKKVATANPKDPIWSRFDIGNAFADLDHVRALLKASRPHAICPYCKGGERGGAKNCSACDGRGWMDEFAYSTTPREMR